MRAVKSVSIDSERRVIITYLDGSTETLYPNCIWCDSEALRQLIKDLLEEKADAITQTIENVTIATFADGSDEGLIKKLLVSIEPIQSGSGDPSPENVRPISGRTGVNFWRTKRNLLLYEDGSYKTLSSSIYFPDSPVWLPTGTYYIGVYRKTAEEASAGIYLKIDDGSYNRIGSNISTQFGVRSFTLDTGAFVTFRLYSSNPVGAEYRFILTNSPLTSEVDEFEPYQGNTYSVTWETEAGTVYGGTLDVLTGKLTVNAAYVLYDGSSDESWSWAAATNRASIGIPLAKTSGSRYPALCCNMGTFLQSGHSVGGVFIGTDTKLWYYPPATVTDLESYITWLSSNNLQVVYELAEPVEYQLTPQEITTLLGDNNIWADSGNILELEYTADTKLYIGEQQSGTSGTLGSGRQTIVNPDIHPVSEKNVEDMEEAYKEEATDERGEE